MLGERCLPLLFPTGCGLRSRRGWRVCWRRFALLHAQDCLCICSPGYTERVMPQRERLGTDLRRKKKKKEKSTRARCDSIPSLGTASFPCSRRKTASAPGAGEGARCCSSSLSPPFLFLFPFFILFPRPQGGNYFLTGTVSQSSATGRDKLGLLFILND